MLRKALRRFAIAAVVLGLLAGGAYAVDRFVLSGDEAVAAPPLLVEVLRAGTFESSHPYAPFYVVPRKRFRDPSRLSRLARNKLLTRPSSALSKGALAGSPQIVRLRLRTASEDPVTVDGVRFRIVSDARPLRGWFTALPGCLVKPVRRAQGNLDARRPSTRYVDGGGTRSRKLALKVSRSAPQTIELQAATKLRRAAWTAELSVRDADGRAATVAVDDDGEPFRVTSIRSSQGYEPVYGAAGISSFRRSSSVPRGAKDC